MPDLGLGSGQLPPLHNRLMCLSQLGKSEAEKGDVVGDYIDSLPDGVDEQSAQDVNDHVSNPVAGLLYAIL